MVLDWNQFLLLPQVASKNDTRFKSGQKEIQKIFLR